MQQVPRQNGRVHPSMQQEYPSGTASNFAKLLLHILGSESSRKMESTQVSQALLQAEGAQLKQGPDDAAGKSMMGAGLHSLFI